MKENSLMKKNLRVYLIALALFVTGMGYLIRAGLGEGSTYHIDVAEALTMPADKLQAVRVFGTVSPERIERAADSLGVRFFLQDQHNPAKTMEVVYKGAVPEGFKPGIELYAEGSCKLGTKMLLAGALTTKCPSKYKKENRK